MEEPACRLSSVYYATGDSCGWQGSGGCVGAYRAVSYEPSTGAEIWSVSYGKGYSNVPKPVFGNGLVVLCTGFEQPDILAVKPTGQGDVTATHIVWTARRGAPLTPSPLLVGDELYFVSDNGIASVSMLGPERNFGVSGSAGIIRLPPYTPTGAFIS